MTVDVEAKAKERAVLRLLGWLSLRQSPGWRGQCRRVYDTG